MKKQESPGFSRGEQVNRGQYTVNSLALLALAVGLAVYDIRTLGISLGERNAHNHHSER